LSSIQIQTTIEVKSTLAKSKIHFGNKKDLLLQDVPVNSRPEAQEQGNKCWVPGLNIHSDKQHAVGGRIEEMIAATIGKSP
jgi:hypothetical protein